MKLKVETRDIKGKNVKSLRKTGEIPAIVYGKNMENPISIVCNKNEFVKLYKKTGSSTPITLVGEGVDEMVLVHDFQLDPVSDVVLHVDFLALTKGEKVSAEVSIIIVGEETAPVVKLGEGNIQLVKDSLSIEALPKDLVKEIEVDVSNIDDVNTVLFVKDLNLPSGIEIRDDDLDLLVVSVIDLVKAAAAVKAAEDAETEADVSAVGESSEESEVSEGADDQEKTSEEKKTEE